MTKRITKLEKELALALDVAARLNISPNSAIKKGNSVLWGNPSPFQDKINELLVKAGRQPILHSPTSENSNGDSPKEIVMPNFNAKSWNEFCWPEWVLPEIKKQIEEFWLESWGRNPQKWSESAVREHAPAFGLRVRMKNFKGELVCGNYIFAWNNIGRLVNDDGKLEYVGIGPFEVSRNGLWCQPTIEDYFTI